MRTRLFLIAYCAGLLSVTLFPVVNVELLLLAAGLATVAVITAIGTRHAAVVFVAGLAVGSCWHLLWAYSLIEKRLPPALEGTDLRVTGVVVSMPEQGAIAQQFKFRLHSDAGKFSDRTVLLNYYGDASIEPGQHWQLLLRLNRPHGFANPAGFDYEAWLLQQRIAAKGYVRPDADNRLLPAHSWNLHALRYGIRQRLLPMMQGMESSGIMLALMLGDRSQLGDEDWQLFSASGTNHLFVISGLHIGLIAGACFWLGMHLLGRFPALANRLPLQKMAALMAISGALGYSLLAGFSLSTQRALVMILVFMLGYLANRAFSISLRFLLALALVLSLNPLAALNAGFWLSFVAVAALLLCLQSTDRLLDFQAPVHRARRLIELVVKPQLVVFVALASPLLIWTGQLSLLSPLVNIVAIPLVGFVIVPLCLAALLLTPVSEVAARQLLRLSDWLLKLGIDGLELLLSASGDWLQVQFPAASAAALLLFGLAMLLLLLPRGVCNRLLLLPLCLPLWFPGHARTQAADLVMHVLDVGQGLAVILRTRSHVLVFDTGARLGPDFNIGNEIVAPVLKTMGIRRIDRLVISHADNDHAGGLLPLLSALPVGHLVSSNPTLEQIAVAGVGADVAESAFSLCRQSQAWRWDGVEFEFLHPDQPGYSENNNSCVLHVRIGDFAILLPGDIERRIERRLALEYGDSLRSSVLLAPHHGSSSSSSYVLLKKVAADYVVFSAGYRNSFNHPAPQVEARYRELGVTAVSTAESGMISFSFDLDSSLQPPRLYRSDNLHYWY